MRQLVVDLGLKASAESAARLDQAASQKLLLDARRRARAATQLQQQQQQHLGQEQDQRRRQGQVQGQGQGQGCVQGQGQALPCSLHDHTYGPSYRGRGLNLNSDDPGPADPDAAAAATVPSVHGVPRHHPWAPPPLEEAWEVLSQALGRCGVEQLNTSLEVMYWALLVFCSNICICVCAFVWARRVLSQAYWADVVCPCGTLDCAVAYLPTDTINCMCKYAIRRTPLDCTQAVALHRTGVGPCIPFPW